MGCAGSKVDHLPLVTLCRERKELIKAASEHRYALAAAHVSYFQSLATFGEALRKFVEEELVIGADSGSYPGSPLLTLPSDDRKLRSSSDKVRNSSSTSISHSASHRGEGHIEIEGSHLNLSSGSDSESELSSHSGHIHIHDSPVVKVKRAPEPGPVPDPGPSISYGSSYQYPYPYPNPYQHPQPYQQPHPYPYQYPYSYPPGEWGGWGMGGESSDSQTRTYYMKKSATPMKSVVFEEPERYSVRQNDGWSRNESSGYPQYGNGGYFSYPMTGAAEYGSSNGREQQEQPPPEPPSPPNASTWDYLNIFETYDNGSAGNYPGRTYGYGSTSSPDSNEVREREGIPDLEDESENDMAKDMYKERMKRGKDIDHKTNSGEGTSRDVPSGPSVKNEATPLVIPSEKTEGHTKAVPSTDSESSHLTFAKDMKSSSSEAVLSKGSSPEGFAGKGVSFGIEEVPAVEIESKSSSLTTLSAHGTRELKEVVQEIKDEFETAYGFGKEAAILLEVGRLPYQSKDNILKVIFSRIKYLIAPPVLSSDPPAMASVRASARTMKTAKAYAGEAAEHFTMKSGNVSSTLEKLYMWEKKLYKEVKNEETLRVIYQKKRKKLKKLDEKGAEDTKIDATQASLRTLQTKMKISIRTVDAISSRIHKVRDEELQPQLVELIQGLVRMWKFMFKCHQKQLQAIMESKSRSLRAQRDSSLRATLELEVELLNWCESFNNWVSAQRSYIKCLNGWLLRCLNREPEETADGVAPFSPGRIGAPLIFVICNDWAQAMERISQDKVSTAMKSFALNLHELWERQDEEQKQRMKAEFVSKDLEKQLRILRMEKGKMERHHDALSDKTAVSKFPSESGVSHLDDLKVDLDSMRKKMEEERGRHKEAMRMVRDASSNSLQAGLVPIFETLGRFTSEVLKGYEHVRIS